MIYVVLGMHKSGTTLVGQLLDRSGISLGDFAKEGGYDNRGYCEPKDVIDIDVELMGGERYFHSLSLRKPVAPSKNTLSSESKINNVVLSMEKSHGNEWGIKSPRMCLTYAVWQKHLPEHAIIGVFRDPLEIFWHHARQVHPVKWPLICWRVLKVWYLYNRTILDILTGTDKPFILFEYANLMSDDSVLASLSTFVKRDIVDVRQKELYRNKAQSSWLYSIEKKLLRWFCNKDVDALFYELESLAKKKSDKEK